MGNRIKTLKPGRSEAQITEQVVAAASAYGVKLDRRNVGGFTNPRGQYVACGRPGEPDWTGTLPAGPHRGKRIEVEIKREGFDPRKLRGAKRAHFERQLSRLRETNESGGFAFWISDSLDFARVLRKILETPDVRIVFEGDYPVMEWE
jgi:hypothetical protein